ncbi:MAG: hypothetical protein J7495_19110 [Sphingomonas sp.]|nr:hypothetical protein [Sphingomonas sp.]
MVAGALAPMLAGCAGGGGNGPGRPIPIEGDSISYETGPCFGRCPVYAVTVRPDGSGVFTGKRFTAVTGEREFRLTPDQYRAFAAKLAPWRPASGEKRYSPGEPGCEHAATDLPSVDITWTRAIGDSQHLYYYYGCRIGDGERPIADALGQAPDLLPIEALIGPRP